MRTAFRLLLPTFETTSAARQVLTKGKARRSFSGTASNALKLSPETRKRIRVSGLASHNISRESLEEQSSDDGFANLSWCECGYSSNQPFCDGAHRAVNTQYGTEFKPQRHTVDINGVPEEGVFLCTCKHTTNAPFCDGSHRRLDDWNVHQPEPSRTCNANIAFLPYEVKSTRWETSDVIRLNLQRAKGVEVPAAVDEAFHFSLEGVSSRAQSMGKTKWRAYTPTRYDNTTGAMELVVKVYEDGSVSPFVGALCQGDTVRLRGPLPGEYHAASASARDTYYLFAGGTGVTPMLQIAQSLRAYGIKLKIYCANRSLADTLCVDELSSLAGDSTELFFVAEADSGDQWPHFDPKVATVACGTRITRKLLADSGMDAYDATSRAIVCGPPLFNRSLTNILCDNFGYPSKDVVVL